MSVSRRTEYVLGLAVPLAVLMVLLVLGRSSGQAAACVAFMAAVPFSALFTGAAFTGIVAAATLVAAVATSASAYGSDFYDAVPIVIGVIVGSGAAVIASQMKSAAAPPRFCSVTGNSAGAPVPAAEPGTDELTGLPTEAGWWTLSRLAAWRGRASSPSSTATPCRRSMTGTGATSATCSCLLSPAEPAGRCRSRTRSPVGTAARSSW